MHLLFSPLIYSKMTQCQNLKNCGAIYDQMYNQILTATPQGISHASSCLSFQIAMPRSAVLPDFQGKARSSVAMVPSCHPISQSQMIQLVLTKI